MFAIRYTILGELFLACLCNLQNESLLNEVDTDKLFSNIQEIYFANLNFWREHVTRMLDASRSSRQPLDPTLLTDAFYKVGPETHNGSYSGSLAISLRLFSKATEMISRVPKSVSVIHDIIFFSISH
ncbi:Pleckstrin y domain-containing family G member 6 [Portunus trituberculatus]|uniref:Pleckstrin y domain-containing family G member 6 n=1 Tax=Portunus trituberculatus TaxID=210409 RepID=A0A5B7IDD3_PORTR|nr:Pleckstrin y domain-containing family G member 6 [Portunus trituberculatus]